MNIEKLKANFEANPDKEKIIEGMRPYVLKLEKALKEAPSYYTRKLRHIESLKEELWGETDGQEMYERLKLLCDEYRDVSFDSMYVYAGRCYEQAVRISDRGLRAEALLKMSKACILGGYFREAGQLLQQVDTMGCGRGIRIDYLYTSMQLEFENGFFFPVELSESDFSLKRMVRLEGALKQMFFPQTDTPVLDQARVMIAFHSRKYDESISGTYVLLSKLPKDSQQYSYSVGDLGYNYMGNGDLIEGMKYMTESAILNIKRGSKEYPAMRKIAETMYVVGDIDHAYHFIQIAMDNAKVFGSKYRTWEISRFYPTITRELYVVQKEQQQETTSLIIGLSVLVTLLGGCILLVVKQKLKVNAQREVIEGQNAELQRKGACIEKANHSLVEAHRIKDMVLARLLTGNADVQLQVDKLKRDALRLLKIRDYEGVKRLFESTESQGGKIETHVDEIILAIFPRFVEQFNRLLKPDCRIKPRQQYALTPEMRIFALIRLGVVKNDDLAKCLNYSVNTIKSYKTKVFNASQWSGDAFYERLLKSVVNEAWQ